MRQIELGWACACAAVLAIGCAGPQQGATAVPPDAKVAPAKACAGALVTENIQVTSEIGESNSPVIAWDGQAFDLAWWDLRGRLPEVHTIRIDKNGVPRSPDTKMPSTGKARDQQLAADKKEVHLVYTDTARVLSTRLGSSALPVVVTEDGAKPAAGAFGAVAWVEAGQLFFRCDGMLPPPNRRGRVTVPPPVAIAAGGIDDPQIAWNGEIYAVVWSGSIPGGRDIFLQRVAPSGQLLGKPVRISATTGISRWPIVAWAKDSFGVAWTNALPEAENPKDRYRVFFALVPQIGDVPRVTRQLEFQASADQVALASTGKEFAVGWVGSRQPVGSAVFMRRIGLDGETLDATLEITDGVPLTCGRPSIAWSGNGYGVAWHDDRAQTGAEIFFAFVACGDEAVTAPSQAADAPAADADKGAPETPPQAKPEEKKPEEKKPALKDAFGGG